MSGIEYNLTGQEVRGLVVPYHDKLPPNDLSFGAKHVDVRGLHYKAAQRAIMGADTYSSRFTIGFEIEKVSLDREALREYELFCGFERDSSCGYEAVTHILPLIPSGAWRNKVFDMFYKAERIIDDRYSPSDVRCGGHINVAARGASGSEVFVAIRKYMGILYALYRYRLLNSTCRGNIFLRERGSHVGLNTLSTRYSVMRVTGDDYVEIRLPNRVTSIMQLMLRYELMYEIMAAAFATDNYPFWRRVKPIIVQMYDDDKERAKDIIKLAHHFQYMIDNEVITEHVRQYVDPQAELVMWYDEALRNEFNYNYTEDETLHSPF